MSQRYASSQPQGVKNHVENVAVIGAGGNVGGFITRALIQQGKHKVTAISRPDSSSKLPEGLHAVKKADQNDVGALAEAMKGQDVLIITMGVTAGAGLQERFIDAAIQAGVRYIMPNEYGADLSNLSLAKETLIGEKAIAIREYIEKAAQGKNTHWVALSCSFWYEFSLGGEEIRYGFDFGKKALTIIDDGNTKICTSTWPQCGRAVAKLLALPILPQDANDKSPTLSQFEDKPILIDSFTLSQRDMFASVLRVTGDKESDWTISHENSQERYKRGVEMLQKGNMAGFGIALYTRVFYPNGGGDFSHKIVNDVLGLPKEDLDAATKVGLDFAKSSPSYGAHNESTMGEAK